MPVQKVTGTFVCANDNNYTSQLFNPSRRLKLEHFCAGFVLLLGKSQENKETAKIQMLMQST